ncbi:MAG: hypothetical protein ABI700_33665 [Chloroflexota bacterium]
MVGLLGGAVGLAVSYLLQSVGNEVLSDLSASGSIILLSVSITSTSGLISIPSDLALFAVALATLIGIGAGLYPAMCAAHMTTVLALKAD